MAKGNLFLLYTLMIRRSGLYPLWRRTNIYKSFNYLYCIRECSVCIYVCGNFTAKTVNSLWIQAVFGLTLVVDSGPGGDWMLVNSSLLWDLWNNIAFLVSQSQLYIYIFIYGRWMKTSKKKASNKKWRFILDSTFQKKHIQWEHMSVSPYMFTRQLLNKTSDSTESEKKHNTYRAIKASKWPNCFGGDPIQTETKRDEKRPRGLTALSNMPEKHRCFLEGGASWWIFKEDVRFLSCFEVWFTFFVVFVFCYCFCWFDGWLVLCVFLGWVGRWRVAGSLERSYCSC